LRIMYPDDEIVYRELGHGSNTTLRVRDDGTFNDRDERGGRGSDEGRRVRIAASGGGLEAHADARIAIPPGKRVELYLAVGQAFASNVDGDLRIDVAAANVTVDHAKGSLLVDTGSGDVRLSDAEGEVSLDTGSGSVTVSAVSGPEGRLDTGSGDVAADRVATDVLMIDTGSGEVTASSVRANDLKIDTGSGNVRLDLLADVRALDVDPGSAGVTYSVMDCGSAGPPTSAMPSGRRDSEPTPTPSAMGRVPMSAAIVVIMMGRNRMRQASRMASCADFPSVRCASIAKSIIMMPFFFTSPTSMITPTNAYTLRSTRKIRSVSSAPN